MPDMTRKIFHPLQVLQLLFFGSHSEKEAHVKSYFLFNNTITEVTLTSFTKPTFTVHESCRQAKYTVHDTQEPYAQSSNDNMSRWG